MDRQKGKVNDTRGKNAITKAHNFLSSASADKRCLKLHQPTLSRRMQRRAWIAPGWVSKHVRERLRQIVLFFFFVFFFKIESTRLQYKRQANSPS